VIRISLDRDKVPRALLVQYGILPSDMISKTSNGVWMSLRVYSRLAGILLLELILISCGDVYRPTIIPNPVPIPDPKNFHAAFTANVNTPANFGSTMQVDVSGDTNAGVTNLGIAPVHLAVQAGASALAPRIWAADPGSDSVSVFAAASSVSGISKATTVNLPTGSQPLFVASTEAGTEYVANSSPGMLNGSVVAIGTTTAAVTATIPVGSFPWAMAETPDGHKLYVANRDGHSLTSINTVDRSIAATIPLSAAPQWVVARGDSSRIYVVTADGTLTTVDSEFSSAQQDTVLSAIPLGAVANFLYYDGILNRLYIPFPASSQVAIYNVAVDPPTLMTTVNLTAVPPGGGSAPCPATGCSPVSAASLVDGSRAYLASFFLDSNPSDCTQMLNQPPLPCIASQVTVVNALNNTVTKVIALPVVPVSSVANCGAARFRISMAAAADGSRIYVSNCDGGVVSIANTTGDKFVLNLPTPASLFPTGLASISSAVQSGTSTTYTYTLTSGTPLWVGMTIAVSGIANPGDTAVNPDNGTFVVTALGAGTFTVNNPSGVSTTAPQNGTGIGQPPGQNPVFIVAGP
jgi:YVTN family beta-propeller protein